MVFEKLKSRLGVTSLSDKMVKFLNGDKSCPMSILK